MKTYGGWGRLIKPSTTRWFKHKIFGHPVDEIQVTRYPHLGLPTSAQCGCGTIWLTSPIPEEDS